MVLVDSSIWIEAARRTGSLQAKVALEALLEEYEACWCGPVKLEVLGGARKEERRKLEFFFEAIPSRTMPDTAWAEATELAWRVRDKGVTAPWNDVLIATLALSWDIRVFAQDAHFDQIAAVTALRLYQPGYGGSYSPD